MLFVDDYIHGAIKQFMNCLLLPSISFADSHFLFGMKLKHV
jgi:hypothetical protein